MIDVWIEDFGAEAVERSRRGDLLIGDDVLHDTARLATSVTGAEFAAITLVDATRIWFAATAGFKGAWTDRSGTFCDQTVTTAGRFVVHDTLEDPRFRDSPFVLGELCIRFYAGLPLIMRDGRVAGTLCVASRQPSLPISQDQYRHLAILAEITLDRLGQRAADIALAQARELSSSIASEAASISAEAARLATALRSHEDTVEMAMRSVRHVVLLDREIHDSLIGIGRPTRPSRRLPDLPPAIATQIDLHAAISISMEDEVDQIVGSAAAVRSRTATFERQAQRLSDLTSLLDDHIA